MVPALRLLCFTSDGPFPICLRTKCGRPLAASNPVRTQSLFALAQIEYVGPIHDQQPRWTSKAAGYKWRVTKLGSGRAAGAVARAGSGCLATERWRQTA